MITQPLLTLLQISGVYADGEFVLNNMHGMYLLMIAIAIIGWIVQARLQSVFKKYSEVPFPGGLTGAEVAERMLRENNIHNVKVTHVRGRLTDHFDILLSAERFA